MALKKIDKSTQHNVALLASHGSSQTKIAHTTGLHPKTVKKILQEPSVIALKQDMEKHLVDLFTETAQRALMKISDEKLEKSTARDLGILAGVCIDKKRLISGESTSNIAILVSSAVRDVPVEFEAVETSDDI